MPSSRRGRHDLLLDHPPQHVVLRLVGDEGDPQLARQCVPAPDLVRRPLRDADVVRLAGAHDVRERLHRLLERGVVVVAVRLVEIDVVGAQPRQRGVDRLHDVLAGEPVVVVSGAGRPEHLREDLEPLATLPLERPTEDRLGPGAGIDVGGVEGGDALVEGLAHACEGSVLLDLGAVGEPVAVRDGRDLQAAVAEVANLHGPDHNHRSLSPPATPFPLDARRCHQTHRVTVLPMTVSGLLRVGASKWSKYWHESSTRSRNAATPGSHAPQTVSRSVAR